MTQHAHTAHQGHRYTYGTKSVLAMQSGYVIEVREIDPKEPWLGQPMTVKASWLTPEPMKYFSGQIP